jgi:group I intron endonuclease
MLNSGIYKIINNESGKIYIGSAIDLKRRKREHFSRLLNKIHENRYLQRAYNKYGKDKFEFIVIEKVDAVNLINTEQIYLDKFQSYDFKVGYNLAKIAGSSLGLKRTPEQVNNLLKARNVKPFFVYNLNGDCLGEFLNKTHASIFIGIKPSSANIIECLNWKKKTLNGKFCIYKHEINRLKERIEFCAVRRGRPFIIYNNTGVHQKFYNQTECARVYCISNKNISACLKGSKKTHKGYKFKYVENL